MIVHRHAFITGRALVCIVSFLASMGAAASSEGCARVRVCDGPVTELDSSGNLAGRDSVVGWERVTDGGVRWSGDPELDSWKVSSVPRRL